MFQIRSEKTKDLITRASILGEMSWGQQQQSNTWGNSGWGKQDTTENREPNGQHHNQCIAGQSGWGTNGPLGAYYDAKCPGCERDRASRSWGSTSPIGKGLALFGFKK